MTSGLYFDHPACLEHDPRALIAGEAEFGFCAGRERVRTRTGARLRRLRCHSADPLAGVRLETDSFGAMTRHVRDLARSAGAPLGAVLEGGYEPAVLADCVIETLQAMEDQREAHSAAPEAPLTSRAAARIGRHWPL